MREKQYDWGMLSKHSVFMCSGLIVAVFLVLLVSGCGGGSGNAAESAPTKSAFVKKVNAACAEARDRAAKKILRAYESEKLKKAATEAEGIQLEVQVFVPILLEAVEADIAKIRAAGTPAGDESRVKALLQAFDRWRAKAEGTPLKVVIANDVFNQAREQAGEYGLKECSVSPFEEG